MSCRECKDLPTCPRTSLSETRTTGGASQHTHGNEYGPYVLKARSRSQSGRAIRGQARSFVFFDVLQEHEPRFHPTWL